MNLILTKAVVLIRFELNNIKFRTLLHIALI